MGEETDRPAQTSSPSQGEDRRPAMCIEWARIAHPRGSERTSRLRTKREPSSPSIGAGRFVPAQIGDSQSTRESAYFQRWLFVVTARWRRSRRCSGSEAQGLGSFTQRSQLFGRILFVDAHLLKVENDGFLEIARTN